MSKEKQIKSTDWLTRGIPKEQLEREKQEAVKEFEAELRKKQIREMARDLCCAKICPKEIRAECIGLGDCDQSKDVAESLYNEGYRKQSEWISVMDELPEGYIDVLYFDGQSIGVDFICSDGTWCEEEVRNNKVTHWMPLPEAPKMKGE